MDEDRYLNTQHHAKPSCGGNLSCGVNTDGSSGIIFHSWGPTSYQSKHEYDKHRHLVFTFIRTLMNTLTRYVLLFACCTSFHTYCIYIRTARIVNMNLFPQNHFIKTYIRASLLAYEHLAYEHLDTNIIRAAALPCIPCTYV